MAAANNPFAGTRDAKGYENGVYFSEDFEGIVKIKRCIFKKIRNGGKEMFFAELEVVDSNRSKDPAGASRTWAQDKNVDGGGKSLQDFCCAVLGVDRKADPVTAAEVVAGVDEILVESLCPLAEDHRAFKDLCKAAFNGSKVRLSTFGKETKKGKEKAAAEILRLAQAGKTDVQVAVERFTVHDWTPFVEAA